MNYSKNKYIKGLDFYRFLGALLVFITHVELLKGIFGYNNYWNNKIVHNFGTIGVNFFFVLSGYLITHLLIIEKNKFDKINIKAFYLRRILRIWPLYFLIVLLGFFILPLFTQININYLQKSFNNFFFENLLLYLIMLPNVAYAIYGPVPHIGQTWSIGIEEQFYFMWPIFINKIKNNRLLATLLLILFIISVKAIVWLLYNHVLFSTDFPLVNNHKTYKLFSMLKFECMGIGAIGAILLHDYRIDKMKTLNIVTSDAFVLVNIILIPIVIYNIPNTLQDIIHIYYSLIFMLLFLNITLNENSLFKVKSLFLNFLGQISYGIYMYHLMIIPLVISLLKNNTKSIVAFNIVLYGLSFLATIIISWFSFRYFEGYFLKLKEKYSLT